MLPIGHVLGETYRVERLLTHGGMAAIYVVAHTRLRRRYALKIIAANLAEQGELIERFNREADILSELQHPHVVDVIDYNIYQERYPYLVMELLDGEDLAHFLRRQRRLDPAVALPIFLQISEALNAVHGAGIIHRDLKPGNVFLCSNGPFTNYTKVLDFGIAKVCNPQAGLQTQNSGLLGTPAYMAPEQVLGPADAVSAKTDQFSLAVILYEMLAGQPAFHRQGEPMLRTLNRVCYEEPETLSDCPLWPVLARALSKNPDDRYPTLQEFVLASGALDLTGSMLVIAQRTRPVRRPALVTGSQVAVSGAPPSLAAASASQSGTSSGASSAESPLSRASQGELTNSPPTPERRPPRLRWWFATSALATVALLSTLISTRPGLLRRLGRLPGRPPVSESLSPPLPHPPATHPPATHPPAVSLSTVPPAVAILTPPISSPPSVSSPVVVVPPPVVHPPPPAEPSRLTVSRPPPARVVMRPPRPEPPPAPEPTPVAAPKPRPKPTVLPHSRSVAVSVEGGSDPQLGLIRNCVYSQLSERLPSLVDHVLHLHYGSRLALRWKDRTKETAPLDDCLESVPVPNTKPLPEPEIRFMWR